MGLFKRLCLAVWSLAGLFFSLALGLTRFGRWTSEATALLAVDAYLYAVQVCGAILLAGLVVTLVRALFSRRPGSVEVASVEGGSVTITRDAIASQAAHVVGSDGTCVARDVIVTSGRRGSVDVHVKVLPYNSLDVMAKGPELHDRLMRELSALCGDRLDRVSVEFLEAQQPRSVTRPEPADEPARQRANTGSEITYVPRPAESAPATDDTKEGE